MSIALVPLLPVDLIDRIFDMRPLDQIQITIIHDQDFCLKPDEYTYPVPIGTTLGQIKEMLLKDSFEMKGWDYNELWLWEKSNPFVDPWDTDEYEADTTLILMLVPKRDPYDDNDLYHDF